MILDTIYKKTKRNKTQEWTVEVEADKYRTISGQTDGKKVISEWTICYAKNEGKTNATTAEEQALKEAQALRKKKLERDYHEAVSNIAIKRHFEPMLAEKWEDHKDEMSYPCYCQPKLDGIRCIVKSDGMWTRAGKPIISAPHVFESLKPLFETNPDLVFDGELYCDKLANDFNKIVSLVKKSKPTKEDLAESEKTIEYHIYDLPSVIDKFSVRYIELCKRLEDAPKGIVLVKTKILYSEWNVEQIYEEYIEAGYEGQMVRVDAAYENKRSKYLLKNKTFIDEEYTILEIHEGEGNRTGTAGYMVFERNGNRFKSNIKGTFEYCVDLWQKRDTLIGKRATVKYFNLTPGGIPRFPYVINVDRESYEG
jgi:DNA ligase-1